MTGTPAIYLSVPTLVEQVDGTPAGVAVERFALIGRQARRLLDAIRHTTTDR